MCRFDQIDSRGRFVTVGYPTFLGSRRLALDELQNAYG